jgi:hypothetical protein
VLAAAGGAALVACASDTPVAAIAAYPERSLPYAPLLLAVKRGLYAEPGVRVALSHLTEPGAVAAALATGSALAGAMSLAELAQALAQGAPLVAFGALTRRLDCHFVATTARSVPIPTLPAVHLGEWRGLRVGVERGPDGSEAFVRLFAAWSNASRWVAQPALAPRPPQRELAAGYALDGEARWSALDTEEALAAALTDRRLEAFIGRAYAAAQTVSYGAGQIARPLADSGENHVLGALPAVLVTRRSGHRAAEEALLKQLLRGVERAGAELTGATGKESALVALPEKDALHLSVAHGLFSPDVVSTAYAADARLPADVVSRYVELSAMTGTRLDVNLGAATTTRFSG